MLISTDNDFCWYLLFVFICFVLSVIKYKQEIQVEGLKGYLCALLVSAIGGLLISIFAILLTSTYYEVNGNGRVKEYHIMYSFKAPDGERIWTYGSKMYCYNKSNEEFQIKRLHYYSFKPISGDFLKDKIEKYVKPHEFFKVPENIEILYFWNAPETVTEKRNFSRYRCLFTRRDKNSIDVE